MRPSYRYPAKPIDNPEWISVLIPTRDRPEGVREVLENFQRTVARKHLFDVWLYVDDDDRSTLDFIEQGEWQSLDFPVNWHVAPSTNSMGDMFNRLWQVSTSNAGIYFPFVDDYRIESAGWDDILRGAFSRHADGIALGYLPDPTAQPHQVTLPIPSAGWLNTLGYFITSRFYYWFEDSWADEVAQLAGRKTLVPFAISTPEGKGKTPRMRNLPFWQFYFCQTLEERYQDALRILEAVHAGDPAGLARATLKARQSAAHLVHKGYGYRLEQIRQSEEQLRDPARVPRQEQCINYLQSELLAVDDLLARLKTAAARGAHADLIETADTLALASYRVPDLDYLKALSFRELGYLEDALACLDRECALAPEQPKAGLLRAQLAASGAAKRGSYYQERTTLMLPAWLELPDRDFILLPEELGQELYFTIQWLMFRDPEIASVLEIGAGEGEGATRAVLEAAPATRVWAVEPDPGKCARLRARHPGVRVIEASSVPPAEYQTERELALFYQYFPTVLNHLPLEAVQRWRADELAALARQGTRGDGISQAREAKGPGAFDLVILDGSQFLGAADLAQVYGARYLVLNYVRSLKNFGNFKKLIDDENYRLSAANLECGCGYAVFERR